MNARNILLVEGIHKDAKQILEAEGHHVTLLDKALPNADLKEALKGVDVIGLRSKTKMTESIIRESTLEAVGAFCIGTNQIDLKAARQKGVVVFNAPFSNTRSVAEMILAEIVVLARRLGDRNNELHQGVWTKSALGSKEVRGKTLGIIGYGHIGRQVGVLAEALGLNVRFFDINSRLPMGNNKNAEDLRTLLSSSDFVTLHVPETDETMGMIGKNELAQMKPGSCLINASRGTVVDIDALREAIVTKHLSGAAIDVFPVEPEASGPGFVSPLQHLPNVFLTPHIGGSTEEAQVAISHEVAHALLRYLQTGSTFGSVNMPSADLPKPNKAKRVIHIHQNVPGVLRDVHRIISENGGNIVSQVLSTDAEVGYLLMDIQPSDCQVAEHLAQLPTTIQIKEIP